MYLLIFLTNILGLNFDFFNGKLLYWNKNNSIFLLLNAIALFNIFSIFEFKSMIINRISNLLLLIYLIHKNILVRTYVRPFIWTFIYKYIGYNNLIFMDLLYSTLIFPVSLLFGFLYNTFIQKTIYQINIKLYLKLKDCFKKYIIILIKYLN